MLFIGAALVLSINYEWMHGTWGFWIGIPVIYLAVGFIETRFLGLSAARQAFYGMMMVNLLLAVFLWFLSQILHSPSEHGYVLVNLFMSIIAYTVMPLPNVLLGYLGGFVGVWIGRHLGARHAN